MSLKQMMENLLQKVNDAHTKVDWSQSGPSAYGLFSSWPKNETFKGVYKFCLEAKHTSAELFQKYRDALHIIIEMFNIAVKNYHWGVNVGHITGVGIVQAKTVLLDIQTHLQQCISKYEGMLLTDFESELVNHADLTLKLAELKRVYVT